MTLPSAIVECDLDDDGVYETDISSYVTRLGRIDFGRLALLERHEPRRLRGMLLDNEDSRFSPSNSSSPYNQSGKTWKQDKRIRVKLQVPTAAVTNLVENPSCETDVVGWAETGSGTLSQDTTQARYGKACVKLTGAVGTETVEILKRTSSRIVVTAWLHYTFRLWARVEGGTSTWKPFIRWYDGGGEIAYTQGDAIVLTQDGAWTEFLVSGTAPGTAVTGKPTLEEQGADFGVGETLFMDGAFLYQSAVTDLPYCDGDVPGSSWSGMAHESTSSRPANPTFTKFTGRISIIACSRRSPSGGGLYQCELSAVSEMDYLLDRNTYLGNMIQKAGDVVIHTVLDRIEVGEIMDNYGLQTWKILGYRKFPALGDFTEIGPNLATGNVTGFRSANAAWIHEGEAGYDYQNTAAGIVVGDGWELDLSSKCNAGETWKFTLWVLSTYGATGKEVKFYGTDSGGDKDSDLGTIPASGMPIRLEIRVEWTGGGSSRKLRLVANEAMAPVGSDNHCFLFDFIHGVKEQDVIERELRMGTGETEYAELEHVAAFWRPARPLLDDVVNSIGGIMWEKGDGTFVFEDYKTRLDSPVPILRFTDSPEVDGVSIPVTSFTRSADKQYSRVTVWSDGDLSALDQTAMTLWSLDKALTLSANEERYLYARYDADENGPLIGSGPDYIIPFTSGSLADSWCENWGFGALIYLKAGGSGAVLRNVYLSVYAGGAVAMSGHRQRASSRSKVTAGDDTGRELEIEMPMQGGKTAAMTDVATRMQSLLSAGREVLHLPFDGVTVEEWLYVAGLEVGDAIWVRHNTGPGNYALDSAYYVEGGVLSFQPGKAPRLSIQAEKAS